MALQSYTQINFQSTRDRNIYKKVRIWGRVNFAENVRETTVKGGHIVSYTSLGQKIPHIRGKSSAIRPENKIFSIFKKK